MPGFRVADGDYPGRSVLAPPAPRSIFFNCRPEPLCTTSIEGDKKYIYNYGKRPEEFYDLSRDPMEKNNIAGEVSSAELKRRREEVLEWRANTAALYDD